MERTSYMQKIMNETYPGIVIEAIAGGFDLAWERLIAIRLHKDFGAKLSEAEVIMQGVGGTNPEDFMKAAKMITKSKTIEPVNN